MTLDPQAKTRVSVIIPNYNHGPYLEARIESVLAQTYRDFEIILLDDASTDGSALVLQRYRHDPRVSCCVINETNSGGPFRQWKSGLDLAVGDLVWIAESDDVASNVFLEKMVECFDCDPSLTVCYCNSEFIDAKQMTLGRVDDGWEGTVDGISLLRSELGHRNIIRNASAAMFRRGAALRIVDSVVDFRYAGDWCFWGKLALLPHSRLRYVDDVLNQYRVHPQSVYGGMSPTTKPRLIRESLRILFTLNDDRASRATSMACFDRYFRRRVMNPQLMWGLVANLGLLVRASCRRESRRLPILLVSAWLKWFRGKVLSTGRRMRRVDRAV
jgi:hypothetical protein